MSEPFLISPTIRPVRSSTANSNDSKPFVAAEMTQIFTKVVSQVRTKLSWLHNRRIYSFILTDQIPDQTANLSLSRGRAALLLYPTLLEYHFKQISVIVQFKSNRNSTTYVNFK